MQQNIKTILKAFGEFVLVSLFISTVPLIVKLDTVILGGSTNEYSFTEISQELLLLVVTVAFGSKAYHHSESRVFSALLSTFFLTFLIRECDIFLDFIYHGLWQILIVSTVLLSITYAVKNRNQLLPLIADFAETKSRTYIGVGLAIVLAFSRLFGTGKLWIPLMGDNYDPHYKSVIQEGLELLGYVFIACGTYFYSLKQLNTPDTD